MTLFILVLLVLFFAYLSIAIKEDSIEVTESAGRE